MGLSNFFINRATIEADNQAVNDGDITNSYVVVSENERCLVQKRRSSIIREQDGTFTRAEFEGFFDIKSVIDLTNRVTVDGQQYLVVSIKRPRDHHIEVKLQTILPIGA